MISMRHIKEIFFCVLWFLSVFLPLAYARTGGQLVLTGGNHSLSNIYPGREIFSPLSLAFVNGTAYYEWRMYYGGWDTEAVSASVFEAEENLFGTPRDRIYVATDYGAANKDGSEFRKYGVVLEPSGAYDDPSAPWIFPDGLHVNDACPVIGPDDKMYLFYTGAYCPQGIEPASLDITNTICVARASNAWQNDFVKSPDNPIIWPWGEQFDGNTFMPCVKYHDGKFKMWFLGAENLDGGQSAAPIAIWYTQCLTDPMYTANWSTPVKVFRTYWAPTTWWDRFPFYIDVEIYNKLSYQIFYTGYNYSNYWDGIQLDHRQVGINSFWSSNGYSVLSDNNNGIPILEGRFHDLSSTYPDGFFMALAYVHNGGWMYYGAYEHPYDSTNCKIYRYQVGCFPGEVIGLKVLADDWLNSGMGIISDLNNDNIVNMKDFTIMSQSN